ncbi:MAG: ATP-binding cassette domain-containing protein [Chlorobiales bacterium]|nr:ATP-binding cassette domain-containing protein [Chlorobiales bacterium]
MNSEWSTESKLAVITENLTREFNGKAAVESLNLKISAGTVFGLLGPNGAGKSTTIKMLTTMLSPTRGTASVAGHSILNDPVGVRKSMGYVSQMLSADGALTGFENQLPSQCYINLQYSFLMNQQLVSTR